MTHSQTSVSQRYEERNLTSEAALSNAYEYGDHKKPTLTHLPRRLPVDIQFSNLSYSVLEGRKKGYKELLKCINGSFRSGELTAIMGPSGAGKSTLMNIVAGYKTANVTGSILINGSERNQRSFRKLSCYIMQENCLLPHLTVQEAMNVSANLKLGKDVSTSAKNVLIQEILNMLNLTVARSTRTINLSGGQKKRLSIALELVNNPNVMFFDEPTSGLDSSSCYQCISLLKLLAQGGRTVICTIHQPSARLFEMFDCLYTLAEGQCIYRGRVTDLVPFLAKVGLYCPSNHNPANYIIEVASGEYDDEDNVWVERLVEVVNNDDNGKYERDTIVSEHAKPKYRPSLLNSQMLIKKPFETVYPTSSYKQFRILVKRTFRSTIRDPTLTHLRFISHLVIGLILGWLCYNIGPDAGKVESNKGCLFIIVLFTMFTAIMPTILIFPSEMGVFLKEHLNYWYSLKSFYLAKTVADLPFQIVFTSIFVTTVYYLTGQPMEPSRVLMFLTINILTAFVAQSIGLLMGAALEIDTAVYVGPITCLPVILFSGFFIYLDAIPKYLRWLSYLSYIRYSFEGSMVAVYGYGREELECSEDYCHFKYPNMILKFMAMDDANFWLDAGVLVVVFVVLRFITYFVLRLKLMMMQ